MVELTFLGGLLVLGAAYLVGHDAGVVGFLESWALIAVCAMAGMISCMLLSLPALAIRRDDRALNRSMTELEAESLLKRHMGRWGWSGAFAGGLLGALLAMVVV